MLGPCRSGEPRRGKRNEERGKGKDNGILVRVGVLGLGLAFGMEMEMEMEEMRVGAGAGGSCLFLSHPHIHITSTLPPHLTPMLTSVGWVVRVWCSSRPNPRHAWRAGVHGEGACAGHHGQGSSQRMRQIRVRGMTSSRGLTARAVCRDSRERVTGTGQGRR